MKITTQAKYNSKVSVIRDIDELINFIKGNNNNLDDKKGISTKILVDEIRKLDPKKFLNNKEYSEAKGLLKKKLPAFTPSCILEQEIKGGFAIHDIQNFVSATNLLSLDFDGLTSDDVAKLEVILKEDSTIYVYFKSPSGGLKSLIKTKIEGDINDVEFQKIYHLSLFNYYKEKYASMGYATDNSCKNINRLCYCSYDKDLYLNESSKIFSLSKVEINKIEKQIEESKIKKEKIIITQNGGDVILEEFLKWFESNHLKYCELDTDVNDHYNHWMLFAFSIINYFQGDIIKGREYFERICQFSKRRTTEEILGYFDNTFSKNYDATRSPSIRFLFNIMKKYGFKFKETADNKKFIELGSVDVPYMLKTTKTYLKEDEITELRKLYIDDIEGEPTAERLNTAVNKIRELYSYNNKMDIQEYIYDSRYIKKENLFLESLKKNNTDSNSQYDKLMNAIKTDNDEAFEILLMDWMFGVFDNVFTYDFYKYIFVLKGKSDMGKTYIVNKLLSPFTTYVQKNFNWKESDKDNLAMLAKSIFIFDDELNATSKSDIESIKTMTSKDKVTYRPPFGKDMINYKRKCSFIGTTNQDAFFKDDTKAIRFFAFEILDVDRKLLNSINFEKMWGYVWNKYNDSDKKTGESYRQKVVELRELYYSEINDNSRIKGKEEEIIYEQFSKTKNYETRLLVVQEYLENNHKSKIAQNILASILIGLGYSKIRKTAGSFWNIKRNEEILFDEDEIDNELIKNQKNTDRLLDLKNEIKKSVGLKK